jgi:large subunit ribosomal protein L13
MKTYSTSAAEVRRTWHVLDAAGVPLGRLASQAAALIRGKHKPIYAPHLDTGDFVVVINAGEVALTGRKAEQKRYYRHSQYPGGLKVRSVREQQERNPARVVERAVFGMLPHNRLGRSLHGHLKVYVGAEHPHQAQVGGPPQPALSQPPPEGRKRKRPMTVRRTPARAAAAAAPASPLGITPTATPIDAPGPVVAEPVNEALEDAEEAAEVAAAETEAEEAAESTGDVRAEATDEAIAETADEATAEAPSGDAQEQTQERSE